MPDYAERRAARPPIQGLGEHLPRNPTTRSKPLPPKGPISARVPNRLASLGKAAKRIGKKKVLGTLAMKAAARWVAPAVAVAATAFDVGATIKEGIGAYKARQHLKRTAKHVSEKYGSIEKATRTRKAMRSK